MKDKSMFMDLLPKELNGIIIDYATPLPKHQWMNDAVRVVECEKLIGDIGNYDDSYRMLPKVIKALEEHPGTVRQKTNTKSTDRFVLTMLLKRKYKTVKRCTWGLRIFFTVLMILTTILVLARYGGENLLKDSLFIVANLTCLHYFFRL